MTLSSTGSKQIDLFFAGPASLALFLGHRLNATAPIQCYEHVSTGHYIATCRLFDGLMIPNS
ncbi:MAG: SAVED domain-containing protein [Candidatus Tectomicrobia bacterium]|nr:SAVED domain-containing protein [Candidatus Tectomicrobia bacterium]